MMALSRTELWRTLGVITRGPAIDKIVERAYEAFEDEEWLKVDRTPHGRSWNTSFHASAFPGGADRKQCGRKALYELMNIPGEKFSPRSRAVMEIGRAVERQIVYRLGHAGITLSGSVSLHEDREGKQLGLVDYEHWLTGSIDTVLDLRAQGHDRVVPMDVKSKDDKGLLRLRLGEKEVEPGYIGQVMAYNHLCRLWHGQMGWTEMGLREAEGGIIYYACRSNPRETWEHWVEWDQEYVEVGLDRLKEWIVLFRNMELPPRPKEWRWTEEPCKWCNFKKLCKQDIKSDIVLLPLSKTVEYARTRNKDYNPYSTIEAVIDTWEDTHDGKDDADCGRALGADRGGAEVHDGGELHREGGEAGKPRESPFRKRRPGIGAPAPGA